VAETQAGKSSIAASHPLAVGSVGVTGTSAANALAEEADVILAVGTRLQDFTTGSWALFKNPTADSSASTCSRSTRTKHRALPLVADARAGLEELSANLAGWRAGKGWREKAEGAPGMAGGGRALHRPHQHGAALRRAGDRRRAAALDGRHGGGQRLRRTARRTAQALARRANPFGYHLEYGYSCMGYEIAGGIGVKMALPERDVVVMVGDGSYLMMNSEIATSVLTRAEADHRRSRQSRLRLHHRLQMATGSERFNNLFVDTRNTSYLPDIDFRAHAESLGAIAEKVTTIDELEAALDRAKGNDRTTVIVIDTDPFVVTDVGGHWWDVAVPEVSARPTVEAARSAYETALPTSGWGIDVVARRERRHGAPSPRFSRLGSASPRETALSHQGRGDGARGVGRRKRTGVGVDGGRRRTLPPPPWWGRASGLGVAGCGTQPRRLGRKGEGATIPHQTWNVRRPE
jgi:3D-(3,5/4)-trihydroxycyclohexane-1,2-dione acylhydrolase (decyclizing)